MPAGMRSKMVEVDIKRDRLSVGSVSFVIDESNLKGVRSRQKFWLGGAAPQTPQFLQLHGWGSKAPPRPPTLSGRSSHLIEVAKRGRLDQMIFFSAPLTTRAPPGCPAERPAWYGSHQFEQTYVCFERFTYLFAYRKYHPYRFSRSR